MKCSILPLVLWLLVATMALSSCGSDPYDLTDDVRTPLPAGITPTAAAPTSTPAPTVVRVAELSEVRQARQLIAEGRYENAVSILNGLYARFRDDQTLRELLASSYLLWGDQFVIESQGSIQQVSIGLQKFVSGLAVAPDSSKVATDLGERQQQAEGYLGLVQELERMTGVISSTEEIGAELRVEADKLATQTQEAYGRAPAYPGMQPVFIRALLLVSGVYKGKGESGKETDVLAGRRQELCDAVLTVQPENAEALACKQDAEEARLALTPKPNTPTPIRLAPKPQPQQPQPIEPARLRFQVLNYNDDQACISVRITGINTSGWSLSIDGLRLGASFGGGDARVCGLGAGQQVTITVRDGGGNPVRGGAGIPSKGSAIMQADWR